MELKVGSWFISGDGAYQIVEITEDKVIAKDEGFPPRIHEFDLKNFKKAEDLTQEEQGRLD